MDDPYQRFLTSMSRVEPHNVPGLHDMQAQTFPGTLVSIGGPRLSEPHPQVAGDPQGIKDPAISDNSKYKGRKKSTATNSGGDVVKHRRTRSGCFTCRSRRVKVGWP